MKKITLFFIFIFLFVAIGCANQPKKYQETSKESSQQPTEIHPDTTESLLEQIQDLGEPKQLPEKAKKEEDNPTEEQSGSREPSLAEDGSVTKEPAFFEEFTFSEESSTPGPELAKEVHIPTSANKYPWLKRATTFNGDNHQVTNLEIDEQRNIYLSGWYTKTIKLGGKTLSTSPPAGKARFFLAKLSSKHSLLWFKDIGTNNPPKYFDDDDFIYRTRVVLGKKGNVFLGTWLEKTEINGKPYTGTWICKFDSKGVLLWSKKVTSSNKTSLLAFASDKKNHIYLLGTFEKDIAIDKTSLTTKNNENIFLVKLSFDGQVTWLKNYLCRWPENFMIVPSQQENILIGGSCDTPFLFGKVQSQKSTIFGQGMIAKLDKQGKFLWGTSFEALSSSTVKLSMTSNSKGEVYFSITYEDSIELLGKKIAVPQGAHESAILIAKLSTKGKLLWSKTILSEKSGDTGFYPRINSMVITTQGNILLAGKFHTTTTFDHIVLEHDDKTSGWDTSPNTLIFSISPSGKALWGKSFRSLSKDGWSNDINQAITMKEDTQGVLHLAGHFYRSMALSTKKHLEQAKNNFSSFLLELNIQKVYSPCSNHSECPMSSHCNDGTCRPNIPKDCKFVYARYCSSKQKTTKTCSSINGSVHQYPAKTCDQGKSCYWGHCKDTCQTNQDCATNQVCTHGNCIEKTFSSWHSNLGPKTVQKVAHIEKNGHIHIAGFYTSNTQIASKTLVSTDNNFWPLHFHRSDAFVSRFTSQGRHLWTLTFTGKEYQKAYLLAVDKQGNTYVSGSFENTMTVQGKTVTSKGYKDIFFAKIDVQGKLLWLKSFGSKGTDEPGSLILDKNENPVLIATFAGELQVGSQTYKPDDYIAAFVARFTPQGKLDWSVLIQSGNSVNSLTAKMDSKGNIFVTGGFYASVLSGKHFLKNKDWSDIFLLKLTSKGTILWSKAFGDVGHEYPSSLHIDKNDDIYLSGSFGPSTFIPTQKKDITFGTTSLTTKGENDIFLTKLDSTGKVLWAKSFGGKGNDSIVSGSLQGNNLYLTGYYTKPIQLGTFSLSSKKLFHFFLAKLDLQGNILDASSYENLLEDSPISIHVNSKGHISLLDATNKVLFFSP